MVFEVGIMDDGEFGIGVEEGCLDRGSFSGIAFVTEEEPFHTRDRRSGKSAREFGDDLGGPVRRTVVNDDDASALEKRGISQDDETLQAGANEILFVVGGNKNGERGGRSHARIPMRCMRARIKNRGLKYNVRRRSPWPRRWPCRCVRRSTQRRDQ